MKVKTLSVMAGLSGSLLLAGSAQADFLGLTWSDVNTNLLGGDLGVGYPGHRIVEVYAQFDSPTDQAVGVVGSPDNPFNVQTSDGSGFFNAAGGGNSAPSGFFAGIISSLSWDSFFTIGLRSHGMGSVDGPGNIAEELIIAPGTPGPNTDPWGNGNTNMAWTVPPTLDGTPTPQSIAGNFDYDGDATIDNKVLLMRLVVAGGAGAGQADIAGSMGVLVFTDAGGAEVNASFNTATPAPGALALLGLAGLTGATRRRRH